MDPPTPCQLTRFLDDLGPDARTRPAVHLSIALAGIGGAATAFGIATAIVGDNGTSRARVAAAAVVIVGLALPPRSPFSRWSRTSARQAPRFCC